MQPPMPVPGTTKSESAFIKVPGPSGCMLPFLQHCSGRIFFKGVHRFPALDHLGALVKDTDSAKTYEIIISEHSTWKLHLYTSKAPGGT